MEDEKLQVQTDLDETAILSEKCILSSSRIEDNNDRATVEIKSNISTTEIMEKSSTSFVVEDTGVIHIKTVSNINEETEESEDQRVKKNGLESSVLKDVKREEKNDTTITDVYLQLDVTDNLDTYLERERVRKLNLSKSDTEGETSKKEVKANDDKVEDIEKAVNVHLPNKKVTSKRSRRDSGKEGEDTDKCEISVVSAEGTKDTVTKHEVSTSEIKKNDLPKSHDNTAISKVEQTENDKKDGRCLWVSNINKSAKANDLKTHFAVQGKVQAAKIVTNGKQCFGYVVMETHDDVVNCIKNMQNSIFEGQQIVLSEKAPEKKYIKKSNADHKVVKGDVEKKIKKELKSSDSKDRISVVSSKGSSTPDPLTLKVDNAKRNKRYSEERRRVEEFERKRDLRERISQERREIERKRHAIERQRFRERERQREKEREREREMRIRERAMRIREEIKYQERKQAEIKLEKEKKKLEYERQQIEKEKLELLRYKRKLLMKQKEDMDRESRDSKKTRNNHDDYERKKFSRIDEPISKHTSLEISKEYWKSESVKSKSSSSFDVYKKSSHDVCVAPPPPEITGSYTISERVRPVDKDRMWYSQRPDYLNRQKVSTRKMDDSRTYGNYGDGKEIYEDRTLSKEQYKPKEVMHETGYTWNQYSDPDSRSASRHQTYQEGTYGVPVQNYYSGSNFRRVNDYFTRPTERKY